MKLAFFVTLVVWGTVTFASLSQPALANSPGLQAGMAKADITPADPTTVTNLWGNWFSDVHDPIYVRALVVAQGQNKVAIISVDTPEISDGMPLQTAIAEATGMAPDHIIIVPTGDHNAPMIGEKNVDGYHQADAGGLAFIDVVSQKIVSAVVQANANLQPARMGVGYERLNININRDQATPAGYIRGQNPAGPSDKTLSVIRFDTRAGEMIGVVFNYAVHGGTLGAGNTHLTGDFAGVAQRYVENHYGENSVAMFTVGAAGDQDPILMSSHATNPQQATPEDGNVKGFAIANVLGNILGRKVVEISQSVHSVVMDAPISAQMTTLMCDGQRIAGTGTGAPVTAEQVSVSDTEPVAIPMGVVRIGTLALPWVAGEPVTRLGASLKLHSPFRDTVFMTLANGRIGYIADKQGFANWTQEALVSTVKKGCGERIIASLAALMRQP